MRPGATVLLPVLAALAVGTGDDVRSQPPGRGPDRPIDPDPVHTKMHGHFSAVTDIHRALLFGDLKRARRRARDLAELTAPGGLPGWEEAAARIRWTGSQLASARSARRARRLLGRLATECGDCHEDSADVSRFVWGPEPFDDGSAAARMARHEWAAESVWMGLVGPSQELWRSGLDVLAGPPFLPDRLTADRERQQAVERHSRQLAALAARARTLDEDRAQADAFADILGVCAGCHALIPR